jgi:hypothetical protein
MDTKWRPETLAATALGREDESTGAITLEEARDLCDDLAQALDTSS